MQGHNEMTLCKYAIIKCMFTYRWSFKLVNIF